MVLFSVTFRVDGHLNIKWVTNVDRIVYIKNTVTSPAFFKIPPNRQLNREQKKLFKSWKGDQTALKAISRLIHSLYTYSQATHNRLLFWVVTASAFSHLFFTSWQAASVPLSRRMSGSLHIWFPQHRTSAFCLALSFEINSLTLQTTFYSPKFLGTRKWGACEFCLLTRAFPGLHEVLL